LNSACSVLTARTPAIAAGYEKQNQTAFPFRLGRPHSSHRLRVPGSVTNKENEDMLIRSVKTAVTAAVMGGAMTLSAGALAGECPVDQVAANAVTSGATEPSGVTDTVIATIDLSSKGEAWQGQMFRMRRLVVEAGGVVPWHQHDVRPANILVVEGSITEYRSSCKVPIEHKAGDVTAEFGNLAHWWKNNTDKPAVLISADILPPQMVDDHTM
jgi:quercetin dioxygenase-like cupin family protein